MRKYKEIGLKPVSHSLILAVEIMRLSIFTLSDIIRYICSMQEMIFDYDIEGENILNMIGRDYMLPIYLDIVDEAKKVINKNIRYMFELLGKEKTRYG